MLTIPSINKEVSAVEQDTLNLEGRGRIAENKLVEASEAKKKIESDIEKIEASIESGKSTIAVNNEVINDTNKKILEIQNTLRNEQQKFDEFIEQKNTKKEEIQTEIDKKEKEKESLNSRILEISRAHDADILEKSKELKGIESQKTALEEDIKNLNIQKASIQSEISDLNTKLEDIKTKIKSANEEFATVNSSLSSLKNEVENQKGLIENNKIIINQQDDKKKEQVEEIAVLDVKIKKKQEEYSAIESQAFSILQKEQDLQSRTAFIKSQYDRAGIKWDPIT